MNLKSVSTIVLSAAAALSFSQCKQQATETAQVPQAQVSDQIVGLKIAYINVDSLLNNYTYYQDLAEEITRKEENYRLALTEEANKWQKEVEDYQKKVRNGVYSSAERAQSEENRLAKKQQAIQEKSEKYTQELVAERDANSLKINETIDNYIKEYNKTHGYNMIVNKAALLFVDNSMDITAEVLEGLNSAYNQPGK
jgi:outer membrane protein